MLNAYAYHSIQLSLGFGLYVVPQEHEILPPAPLLLGPFSWCLTALLELHVFLHPAKLIATVLEPLLNNWTCDNTNMTPYFMFVYDIGKKLFTLSDILMTYSPG